MLLQFRNARPVLGRRRLLCDNTDSDEQKREKSNGNVLYSWCYSTQSAMKIFVSPVLAALRFEAKTSFFPSGENIGNPSNVSLNVIRSSRCRRR